MNNSDVWDRIVSTIIHCYGRWLSYTMLESKNSLLITMMRKVKTLSPCTISMLVCIGVCCRTKVKMKSDSSLAKAETDISQDSFLRGNAISPLVQTLRCCCRSESVCVYISTITTTGNVTSRDTVRNAIQHVFIIEKNWHNFRLKYYLFNIFLTLLYCDWITIIWQIFSTEDEKGHT